MKTRTLLLISMLALILSVGFHAGINAATEEQPQAGKIFIISSPELYGITTLWAEEYQKNNPAAQIEVTESDIKSTQFLQMDGLVFLSDKDLYGGEIPWKMTVAREIVVPVINASNPYYEELSRDGVSREALTRLFSDPGQKDWGILVKGAQGKTIHAYVSENATVLESIRQYLGFVPVQEMLANEQNLISNIENDPYAIGFCKLSSVLNSDEGHLAPHILLLPIDKNGNGKLDYIEDIYTDPLTLTRGVWIGKYPRELTRSFYAVSSNQPENAGQVAFLKWVLTTGQEYLPHSGMTSLAYSEAQSRLDKLIETREITPPTPEKYSVAKIILFVVVISAVLSIMIGAIAGFRRKSREEKKLKAQQTRISLGFDDKTVDVPKGLLYDRTHTWAFMEQDGYVKIGIDDFLQHVVGKITRVEMKHTGEKIRKGELLVTIIQKGKQLNLYAPVSGTILESNPELFENPSLINDSPYNDGWLYRIEPANWLKEMTLLNMAGKYIKWLGEEMFKLKDFLAFPSTPQQLKYLNILQDGGLLQDHVMEEMGPQVWEEFQSRFLDVNK